METLAQRLQREGHSKFMREYHGVEPVGINAEHDDVIDQIISHTISETRKESEEDIRLLTEEIERLRKDLEKVQEETVKEAVRVIYEGMLLGWRDGMEDNSPLIKASKVIEDLQTAITTVEGLGDNK